MTRLQMRSRQPEPQTRKRGDAAKRVPRCASVWMGLVGIALLAGGTNTPGAAVSFRNEVEAVISKAGCNAGTCHGNKYGKGGFKLSLRGQDPELDLLALTRDGFARRVNPFEPEQSLALIKASSQVSHEGGLRFKSGSDEYEILRRWIAEGARDDLPGTPALTKIEVEPEEQVLVEPADRVQIKAWATFSDGTRRDITQQAVYEPANTLVKVSHDGLVQREQAGETTVLVRFLQQQKPVRLAFVPARPDFKWSGAPEANYIDHHVFAKLRTLRLNPSGLSTDTVFLRRVYLDLLGLLPTAREAQDFAADRHRDKRARMIDQLLKRPEFADFWALKWADLLRNEEKALDRKGTQTFQHWIRQSIAENKPLDQFVREIVAARGSTYQNPPANFYRAIREPAQRAESAAQLFLGVRLQCAQCHNHPFDRWSQDDYYNWATVFSRVGYKVLENKRRDGLDTHEFNGEQIVLSNRGGELTNVRTGKPATPCFLGAGAPYVFSGVWPSSATATSALSRVVEGPIANSLPSVAAPGDGRTPLNTSRAPRETPALQRPEPDRLDELAVWLTSPQNPLFARAQVNRIWFNLMGRGLVDPIDDFRPTNPPSHPALLEALTKDFVAHKFDSRYLIRLILNSRAFQLSAEPTATNAGDEVNYSHSIPRRLSAEQLLDAQHEVLGVAVKFTGYPSGLRASQLPGGTPVRRSEMKASSPEMFLSLFGKPARLLTCECERSGGTTMGQAFQLISGPAVHELLTTKENRLGQLLASGKSNREMVADLYWNALSRAPAETEAKGALAYLEKSNEPRLALEDLAWSLINAKEFVLRY